MVRLLACVLFGSLSVYNFYTMETRKQNTSLSASYPPAPRPTRPLSLPHSRLPLIHRRTLSTHDAARAYGTGDRRIGGCHLDSCVILQTRGAVRQQIGVHSSDSDGGARGNEGGRRACAALGDDKGRAQGTRRVRGGTGDRGRGRLTSRKWEGSGALTYLRLL